VGGEIGFHRKEHREDRQQKQRDFDELGQGIYHQHATLEVRLLRQREHPGNCDRATNAGDHRTHEEAEAQLQAAQCQEVSSQQGQHCQDQDGFRRGELEQFKCN
jgi:hypothetical protein